jgi:hypothetical protein
MSPDTIMMSKIYCTVKWLFLLYLCCLRERIIFLTDLKQKNFLSALQMGINARITVIAVFSRGASSDWGQAAMASSEAGSTAWNS